MVRREGDRTDPTRVVARLVDHELDGPVEGWLQRWAGYERLAASDVGDEMETVDLCLVDRAGFEWFERRVDGPEARDAGRIPCLLALPAQGRQTAPDWTEIGDRYGRFVDDVLVAPLQELDVRASVESAIRLRRRSAGIDGTETNSHERELMMNPDEHALYVTDTNGTIEFVNSAFTDLTGYGAEESCGQTPAILRSGKQGDEYYRKLWSTVAAGGVWEETIVNERKNGQLYHATQTIVPVLDDTRSVQKYVAVQTDTTSHRDTDQLLEVLDRILRHNLRNEVSVIMGQAEILERATTGELAARADSIVEKAVELISRADKERKIVRLLRRQAAPTEQGLAGVIDRAVGNTRDDHPAAEIDVSVPNACSVTASPAFQEAVEELLANAIVHNDATTPMVDVSVTEHPSTVDLTIADNGPGISEQEIDIMNGAQSISPLYHGSGLGLWLVYWITVLSGGWIAFEPNDSGGSIVTIHLTDE